MPDLSILIPSRNEVFLRRTIEDILEHSGANTEVIAVLDGAWADPPIPDHDRVTLIYHPESIGQRAATNEAAKLSNAKYVMKVDAHCSFDQGFDVKMMDAMQDDWTMVPVMKNLHAFDWVCKKCGDRRYQGPDPTSCPKCDGVEFERDVVWRAKPSPNSTSYRFDRDLRFKYFGEYKKRQEGDLVDTMSLQGSCFMATREKYWELGLCDESWGSWGQQGTEVSLKTHLSGGRVICNRLTWYAHLFRTQPGFSWPYPAPGKSQQKARQICQDIFLNDRWPKATHKLQWLIDKFSPVPDWEPSTNGVDKAVIYYTDNRLDPHLMKTCQAQLRRVANGIPVIAVSLKPIEFGDKNIVVDAERGYLTMFRQILAGLEASDADVVFLAEHDILYSKNHLEFTPDQKDRYFYNTNVWKVRVDDGHALHYLCQQTSGLCAYRSLLLDHYKERVRRVETEGFSRRMGFEPGTHNRKERVDDYKASSWMSDKPNIDLRHEHNLTPSRWRKDQFRNQKYTKGWTEAEEVPGWGHTKDRMEEFLANLNGDLT